MASIQFIGVGSAFTLPAREEDGSIDINKCDWQSNMVITADNGKKLLIDCGGDVRFALAQLGIEIKDLDGVYISHLHADHVGGMEWKAFSTYFNPSLTKPKLYCDSKLMDDLWEKSLRGGLESIQNKLTDLTDYFECKPIEPHEGFHWEGINFPLIQTIHVMSGRRITNSFGFMMQKGKKPRYGDIPSINPTSSDSMIFLTTDTQFAPRQIETFYSEADIILQDCETAHFASGVHAHYNDLLTLPEETKRKMWLYHYQPDYAQDARGDGFAGFIQKGQIFEF